MTRGQVTQQEAMDLALRADHMAGMADGTVRFYCDAPPLWWIPRSDLHPNPQPSGWRGGLPDQRTL
jgi:hypothetical protein